jgi:hypothetical protein
MRSQRAASYCQGGVPRDEWPRSTKPAFLRAGLARLNGQHARAPDHRPPGHHPPGTITTDGELAVRLPLDYEVVHIDAARAGEPLSNRQTPDLVARQRGTAGRQNSPAAHSRQSEQRTSCRIGSQTPGACRGRMRGGASQCQRRHGPGVQPLLRPGFLLTPPCSRVLAGLAARPPRSSDGPPAWLVRQPGLEHGVRQQRRASVGGGNQS